MITLEDVGILLAIVFIEGILSVDNAIVLATLAKRLPPKQQAAALKYGMFGAFAFRLLAVWLAEELLQLNWVNYIGGAYLIYMGAHYFLKSNPKDDKAAAPNGVFWKIVLQIELTDIIFSIDSIVAAVGLSSKYWIVVIGGILGIILIRFLSSLFIKLLSVRPLLEASAYFVIILVGIKVILEGLQVPGVQFHSADSASFWIFWIAMISSFAYGMLKKQPVQT